MQKVNKLNLSINMKRLILSIIVSSLAISTIAQNQNARKDSTTFKGYLYNGKFDVYIQMDFYHKNIIVPYQEIYGELPGYFGDRQDGRKWLITDAYISNPNTANLQIINDYGSEDLTATIKQINDTTYELKQEAGSTLKIARNHKWVKMPKVIEFIKKSK